MRLSCGGSQPPPPSCAAPPASRRGAASRRAREARPSPTSRTSSRPRPSKASPCPYHPHRLHPGTFGRREPARLQVVTHQITVPATQRRIVDYHREVVAGPVAPNAEVAPVHPDPHIGVHLLGRSVYPLVDIDVGGIVPHVLG